MNIDKNRFLLTARSALGLILVATALLISGPAVGQVLVDDNFEDGDLADTGTEPLESDWWTSSSSSGLEASPGILGMVTGTSGRGFHTIFPTQSLNVGDSLKATYTFTTPATVRPPNTSGGSGSFRIGLYDDLGRAGLDDNVSASSGSPNELYGWAELNGGPTGGVPGLPGYMLDMDVNKIDDMGLPDSDLNFRQHNVDFATGRLMATTGSGSFSSISPSGEDGLYTFDPNSTYQGSFMVQRISGTEMELTGTLSSLASRGGLLTMHSVTDEFDSSSLGMFGIHVNSNQFGSTNQQGEPDNGLDFSNITIEFIPIPEPSLMGLLLIGMLGFLSVRRQR